jgi:hypothetical protein
VKSGGRRELGLAVKNSGERRFFYRVRALLYPRGGGGGKITSSWDRLLAEAAIGGGGWAAPAVACQVAPFC